MTAARQQRGTPGPVSPRGGPPMATTRWWLVHAAFVAGCIGAAQIGKVAAALSVLIADLDLALVQAGLVVSLFTVTTALTGMFFGMLGDRFGHLPLALTGMFASAAGAIAGAFAGSVPMLLATRLVEGIGFTLAVVCLPPLISRVSSDRDRPVALGLWAAFMPAGMAMAMLVSPWLLDFGGWRAAWLATGGALVAWAVLLWLAFRGRSLAVPGEVRALRDIAGSMLRPGPMLMFGCFACYSAMYVPLTAFFTTLLVSQKQIALHVAVWMGAAVVATNVVGNLSAGYLVRRGHSPHRLAMLGFVVMGVAGCLVFLAATPVAMKLLAGLAFSAFGGLIPGVLFILSPTLADHPAKIAALSGLLLQGAGLGQTLGPMLVSASVDHLGAWGFAGITLAIASVLGMFLAMRLARRGGQARGMRQSAPRNRRGG